MIMYHATDMKNLDSIMEKGILKSYDGIVYLTEKPEDAAKFLAIRLVRNILVCEVDVEDYLIEETFDHSEKVFKCKAYGYKEDIPPEQITNYLQYTVGDNPTSQV